MMTFWSKHPDGKMGLLIGLNKFDLLKLAGGTSIEVNATRAAHKTIEHVVLTCVNKSGMVAVTNMHTDPVTTVLIVMNVKALEELAREKAREAYEDDELRMLVFYGQHDKDLLEFIAGLAADSGVSPDYEREVPIPYDHSPGLN